MLKKIPVHRLRMGMHLHKLEGSWIAHPFWKASFVIDTQADLDRVQECGVAECWIDTALGLDVMPVVAAQAAPIASLGTVVPRADQVAQTAPAAERPQAAELMQAAAICQRGRAAVTAMFNEARMGHSVNAEHCLPLVEEISGSVQPRRAGQPGAAQIA